MIIVDSGFWVALVSPRDRWHERARALLAALDERLVTTWPAMTEAVYLIGKHVGAAARLRLIDMWRDDGMEVVAIERSDAERIRQLMVAYADLPMDLSDATLVLLAERLGHGRILSTDRRDFEIYRWKNRHPFTNLLLRDGP